MLKYTNRAYYVDLLKYAYEYIQNLTDLKIEELLQKCDQRVTQVPTLYDSLFRSLAEESKSSDIESKHIRMTKMNCIKISKSYIGITQTATFGHQNVKSQSEVIVDAILGMEKEAQMTERLIKKRLAFSQNKNGLLG